ncbi:MAG: PadR family transcriptional regulator [Caulobacteraceae bacterium]|nr:PadR family transcriptional regulator [Caulobacteraceae bacterium]
MHPHFHRRGAWRAFAHPRRGFGSLHDHDRGRERHERRHHRGGRVFDQGDLKWVILQLIADKPSHGYELIKTIEERLGGAYSPSPGVIYPTLTLLEDLGYIAPAAEEGSRRAYAITDDGRQALEENSAAVRSLNERMEQIAERSAGRAAPQIVRAMENLRVALRLRLDRGPLSPEQIARLSDILDDTARAIERD